jgi:hypothetical protein
MKNINKMECVDCVCVLKLPNIKSDEHMFSDPWVLHVDAPMDRQSDKHGQVKRCMFATFICESA